MKHGHHAATHVGPSARHDRQATIRDMPPHLLAARVAAHLSAADAARLMQAAGTVHKDELKHVMDEKKKETVVRKIITELQKQHPMRVVNFPDFQIQIERYGDPKGGELMIAFIPWEQPRDDHVSMHVTLSMRRFFPSPDVSHAHLEWNKHWKEVGFPGREWAKELLVEIARRFSGKSHVKEFPFISRNDFEEKYPTDGAYAYDRETKRVGETEEKKYPGSLPVVVEK